MLLQDVSHGYYLMGTTLRVVALVLLVVPGSFYIDDLCGSSLRRVVDRTPF